MIRLATNATKLWPNQWFHDPLPTCQKGKRRISTHKRNATAGAVLANSGAAVAEGVADPLAAADPIGVKGRRGAVVFHAGSGEGTRKGRA